MSERTYGTVDSFLNPDQTKESGIPRHQFIVALDGGGTKLFSLLGDFTHLAKDIEVNDFVLVDAKPNVEKYGLKAIQNNLVKTIKIIRKGGAV